MPVREFHCGALVVEVHVHLTIHLLAPCKPTLRAPQHLAPGALRRIVADRVQGFLSATRCSWRRSLYPQQRTSRVAAQYWSRWANTRRKQVQQLTRLFAITSSAVESKLFGTVRPGTLAVLRLSTSSNLVGRRLAARGRRLEPDTARRIAILLDCAATAIILAVSCPISLAHTTPPAMAIPAKHRASQALAEIEQVRIREAGNNILDDDHHADPGCDSTPSKQDEMRGPHR